MPGKSRRSAPRGARSRTGVSPVPAHRQDADTTSHKTTLAEASRDRLARPLRDPKLLKEFERATGESVDPQNPPTWAELIVAKEARQAVSENGTREAKELRDTAEGSKSDSTRVALLLSLDGLPRTNAVSGR